jgi:YD repeat-containing protein
MLNVGTSGAPWTWTANGQLASIPGMISSIAYAADGQTQSIDYANGVTTGFTYNADRRWLRRINTRTGRRHHIARPPRTHDGAGHIVSMVSSGSRSTAGCGAHLYRPARSSVAVAARARPAGKIDTPSDLEYQIPDASRQEL